MSNSSNKQSFINHAEQVFSESPLPKMSPSQTNADLLMVQTAVESARRANTVLVEYGTDLLSLLCYYTEISAEELFFQPEPRANSTKRCVWNINVLKEKLGQDVSNNIMGSSSILIHAILQCDTTSHLHEI